MSSYRKTKKPVIKKIKIIYKSLFQIKKTSINNSTPPNGIKCNSYRRIAFCISCPGSLTVEAAWTIPLFFLAMVAMISMIGIYGAIVSTTVELQEKVEKMGMYASVSDAAEDWYIDVGKDAKISLQGNSLGLAFPTVSCRGRVHPWTGRSEASLEAGAADSDGQLVYVTDYRSVYHTSARCTNLKLSIRAISKGGLFLFRTSSGAKYQPCEKCVGSGAAAATVYITDQGDCYHNSISCSGLTRSIEIVSLEEVAGLHECSKCQQLEQSQ